MTTTLLPTKRDLFTRILTDAEGRDEHPEAFDRAIAFAETEFEDFTYEEIISNEEVIKSTLSGFMQGVLSK